MVNYLVLDFNRPIESELCLHSIKKYSKFDYKVIYLSNGGIQDYVINYYKNGLIDKLILRKKNSGCGLGVRELFNDFDLDVDYVILMQCDQFLYTEFSQFDLDRYISAFKSGFFYVDLAGNQGHGNFSERGLLINKYNYNKIPNTRGGPGPYANEKWTEQSVQEYIKENKLKFLTAIPALIADNGKCSFREYPDGGELIQYTDEKSVYIIKPIKKRVDFPNLKLTDNEWDLILSNKWINGTIPELHKKDSFVYWERPYSIENLPQ